MAEPTDVSASATMVAVSPDSFTEFEKLPIELRLKIWKLAIPKDRVIAIVDRRSRKVSHNGDFKGFSPMLSARYTVPAVMQVSKESRSEVKKPYTYILKDRLGMALPFNFKHDTLLMDGPDGIITMWSFEKACRHTERSSKELSMIHANLKHLAIHGQRLNTQVLNEVQQYTGLETLVLPANPYWNSPEGSDAFNLRISERLRATWTLWKAKGLIKKAELVSRQRNLPREQSHNHLRHLTFSSDSILPPVGYDDLYLAPIQGDMGVYTNISPLPAIDFLKEDQLKLRLAAGTWVTLSYIDHPKHPAALAASKRALESSITTTFDDSWGMPWTTSRVMPPPLTGRGNVPSLSNRGFNAHNPGSSFSGGLQLEPSRGLAARSTYGLSLSDTDFKSNTPEGGSFSRGMQSTGHQRPAPADGVSPERLSPTSLRRRIDELKVKTEQMQRHAARKNNRPVKRAPMPQ